MVDLDLLNEKVASARKLRGRLDAAQATLTQANQDAATASQQIKQFTQELEVAEKEIIAVLTAKESKDGRQDK